MGKVGDRAHTPHGLGEVKEIITERGRKSFRVAGSGFSVWVDETKLRVATDLGGPGGGEDQDNWHGEGGVLGSDDPGGGATAPGLNVFANENLFSYGPMMDYAEEEREKPQYMMGGLESTIDPGEPYSVNEKNHTTLPWSGKNVQNHVDNFRQDQTILPGEFEFDPDDRLHPSDSLSGASRSKPSGPQPNPELFAGGGGDNPFWERDANQHALGLEGPDMSSAMYEQHMHDHPEHGGHISDMGGEPSGPIRAAWDVIGAPANAIGWGLGQWDKHHHKGSFERPAGLDKRYAFFEIEADGDSPAAEFRRDPQGFIRTCGHLWTDGDDSLEKFADYTDLLDTDKEFRTAAWADVRAKAVRLRHEGAVTVNDAGPNRMYASVQGDNGLYDVMIYKAGDFGGNQSILDWACSCEWGRWAFKRKFSYVGRLCSHAYATYLHMGQKKQAASTDDYKTWLNENSQAPEAASIANYLNTQGNDATDETVNGLYDYVSKNPNEVPERNFDTPYDNDPEKAYKSAELLRQKPLSLTPNLREVPKNTDHDWVDVTKDDREDTGPDDIVHFSSVTAMQYLHGASEGITDFFAGGVGGSAGGGLGGQAGTGGTTLPDPNQSDPGGGTDNSGDVGGPGGQLGGGAGSPGSGGNSLDDPAAGNYLGNLHRADVLDDLRNLDPAYESNGHMEERNDHVRDLTDKAQDEGFDASQFVASLHQGAGQPSDGDANFLGQSNPNWADMGFAGSGPDPKDWISDSAGYVKENEDPHVEKEWFDHPDDDIIKYNDSRSAPQQGPRKSSRTADLSDGVSDPMSTDPGMGTDTSGGMDQTMMASLHHEWDDSRYAADASGYFNPNNAGAGDWDAASGDALADSVGNEMSNATDPTKGLDGGDEAPEGDTPATGETGAATGGEGAAAGGELAELAPLAVAASRQGGFNLDAFDRGEFSFDDTGGGGELRRASRVGGGAKSQVRVDPGARGQRKEAGPGQTPPEDFGYDGERELEAYLKDDQGDPSGMDILAAFQSSGAASAVMSSGPAPRVGGADDFASSPMVQSMLRTAGRVFSPEDQRELEAEFHPQGARNLPTPEELAGTHYAMGL